MKFVFKFYIDFSKYLQYNFTLIFDKKTEFAPLNIPQNFAKVPKMSRYFPVNVKSHNAKFSQNFTRNLLQKTVFKLNNFLPFLFGDTTHSSS